VFGEAASRLDHNLSAQEQLHGHRRARALRQRGILHEEENEAIRLLGPLVMIVVVRVRIEIGEMMNQVRARGGHEDYETHDHPERLQTTA
jgi:hypothetical protein